MLESQTGSMNSFWAIMCGNSGNSNGFKNTYSSVFLAIIDPTTCINHMLVMSIDALLLMCLLIFITKRPPSTRISALQACSGGFNSTIGLAYLCTGLWILGKAFIDYQTVLPLHGWLVMISQGLTWLLFGSVLNLKRPFIVSNITVLSSLTIVSSILAVILSALALRDTITNQKITSVKSMLDMLLFPGAIFILVSKFWGSSSNHEGLDADDTFYTPLRDETMTPFSAAGFLNRMTFWWLNPLMKKGKAKVLEDDDIPCLRKEDQTRTCYREFWEQLSKRKANRASEPNCILPIILSWQWKAIVISGMFALIKVLTLATGPLFLKAFIIVAEDKNNGYEYQGCALASLLFLTKCLESFSERQWHFRTRLIGLQVRSMLSAAIYQKQLRLSSAAKSAHSPGQIVNYVAVDAYRIGEFPFWLHQIWTVGLQTCLGLMIIYYCVGLATVASITVIVLSVVVNSPLGKIQHKYQMKLMAEQDRRVRGIIEALMNIKVLKLYAWEMHFKKAVDKLRETEFKWLSIVQLQKAYYIILFWSFPTFISVATFSACYLIGIGLDASNVFTFLATLRIIQDPVRSIPDVAGAYIEASVSLDRIAKFLDAPELHYQQNEARKTDQGQSVFISSTGISWDSHSLKPTLRKIELVVKPGEKVAICGEVGAGKSTLLGAILGEVPNVNGTVQVHGKTAYVSQSAWIQTGTIRENILFGSKMNTQRYKDALERCALLKDIEMLPFGDLTGIGERGVNLSGGQKQRIQLARALYQDADVYLLDDPFSAVDAHTATRLFNDYVMEALSGKTVVLVTHQVDFLPAFNSVLLMHEGQIIASGTYIRLMASSPEFQNLVNAHKDSVEARTLKEEGSLVTEKRPTNGIQRTCIEEQTQQPLVGDQLIQQEERETGDTGVKPYMKYLSHEKGFICLSLAILAHILFLIGQTAQGYWLAAKVQSSSVSKGELILVYSVIGCGMIFFLVIRSVLTYAMSLGASNSVFSTLLGSLFRAPMSFFDSTPIGRILSRVSSDMSIVDLDIAFTISQMLAATIATYFTFCILTIFTWEVLFIIIPMIYLTRLLQQYYFHSAKELMRINGTTRSTVASNLAESISGATTIRAFEKEDQFFSKNMELIDKNASPVFHSFSANEWLIQRLEILCIVVLSFSALALTLIPFKSSSSGFVGMALSYGLSLNICLVASVQSQCVLANMIVSAERLEQYMHIPSESPEVVEANRPAPNWPNVGKVVISNLMVRYRPDAPLVLKGISCDFEGGSKIGIVGRTGSGKTTLISAMFRLVEPSEGNITIDGIDISTIGLHDLRSHLGIIPQDPTLFYGSVRYNLDPLAEHTDQEIWEVLDKCQLEDTVQGKEGGLDSTVVQDGSNWSMGQRQLFCLGRALLKRRKILVLDEATASIDNHTDAILQRTIRKEFEDCTVITVAHRIPTVMDSTKILAISDGELAEFDEPTKLMNKKDSLFGQLVREYQSYANKAGMTI